MELCVSSFVFGELMTAEVSAKTETQLTGRSEKLKTSSTIRRACFP